MKLSDETFDKTTAIDNITAILFVVGIVLACIGGSLIGRFDDGKEAVGMSLCILGGYALGWSALKNR